MEADMSELNQPTPVVRNHPSYARVFMTFARNSLVRDMSFRANFFLQCISSVSWTMMNLGFFIIVFQHTKSIGSNTGWGEYEFFIFLATTWIVNALVQAFFMPNAEEFSELIRTGNLDFALLKPIDTQFLISFTKIEWSSLANLGVGAILLCYALIKLSHADNPLFVTPLAVGLYIFFVLCGTAILYSLMITLAATSIWLGRNQTLYNFWFYITNFCRYPMEIYQRGGIAGWSLWGAFTFVIPILVVINVPARILARPLRPDADPTNIWFSLFALIATIASLVVSRMIFKLALRSYRSASS
jgi:ABC-2 type transport system permease protein